MHLFFLSIFLPCPIVPCTRSMGIPQTSVQLNSISQNIIHSYTWSISRKRRNKQQHTLNGNPINKNNNNDEAPNTQKHQCNVCEKYFKTNKGLCQHKTYFHIGETKPTKNAKIFTFIHISFLCQFNLIVLVKQNEDWKKIPGTGISNHSTGKKIPGAGISNHGAGKKNPGYRDFKFQY